MRSTTNPVQTRLLKDSRLTLSQRTVKADTLIIVRSVGPSGSDYVLAQRREWLMSQEAPAVHGANLSSELLVAADPNLISLVFGPAQHFQGLTVLQSHDAMTISGCSVYDMPATKDRKRAASSATSSVV